MGVSAQSLIDQILAQLECRVSSIFFNKAHVTEWLEQGYGLESDVSRNTAERWKSRNTHLDEY